MSIAAIKRGGLLPSRSVCCLLFIVLVPMRLYIGPPENAPPIVTGGVSVLSTSGEVWY